MGGRATRRREDEIVFAKIFKDLYTAGRQIEEVRAGRATFLAVDGAGDPGGKSFEEAMGQLYSLAYAAKWTLKLAGELDFAVGCPECLYDLPKRGQWSWRLLIRIPDAVTARHLAACREELARRKGLDTSRVRRTTWAEGRALQVLHVGPYDQVGPTYEALAAHARARGLTASGRAHEIYVSDPRRVAPERLRTIVRLPVRRG